MKQSSVYDLRDAEAVGNTCRDSDEITNFKTFMIGQNRTLVLETVVQFNIKMQFEKLNFEIMVMTRLKW